MSDAFLSHMRDTLAGIEAEGLMKTERLITFPVESAHLVTRGILGNILVDRQVDRLLTSRQRTGCNPFANTSKY